LGSVFKVPRTASWRIRSTRWDRLHLLPAVKTLSACREIIAARQSGLGDQR
jgi:hypothetical protein